jgi:hypothetical protein
MKSIIGLTLALLLLAGSAFAACTTGIPYQAKADLLAGVHLTTDTYKVASFTSAATYGTASTVYSATSEVSGTGYTAGGFPLAAPTAALYTATGVLDFPDDVNNTITFGSAAECSIVYNTSKSNKILFVQQHSAVTPAAVTLTYDFPAAGASTSFLRIAKILNHIISPTAAYADEGGVTITIEGAPLISAGGM